MTRILVVEDESVIRANIVDTLRLDGYEVVEASRGPEGAEMAVALKPELIVCDVMMPGMNGYELLEAVRNNHETRSVPFVFVSALSGRSDLRKGMELGADDYIGKPFEAEELLRAVAARLDRARDVEASRRTRVDPVTGLPSDEAFAERIGSLAHTGEQGYTLALISAREMHQLRMAFGAGPHRQVIAVLAERLKSVCEGHSECYRLSEGSFAVLAGYCRGADDAMAAADSWLSKLKKPVRLGGEQVRISFNVGVVHEISGAQDWSTLLHQASVALSSSVAAGKNVITLYDDSIVQANIADMRIASEMDGALERGEFQICYQPIMDMRMNTLSGMEALLRWHHPQFGTIAPFTFIPLAEETGFINRLGDWVLRESCRQTAEWNYRFGKNLAINVNVSPFQLEDTTFAVRAAQIVRQSGLDAEKVHLELTENIFSDSITEQLEALAEAELKLAIDDFGTGYSSFERLNELPFSILKIDRSFFRDFDADSNGPPIVGSIVNMGHSLGMQVVAEGIETREQRDLCREIGCDYLQGYYYSRPLPAAVLTGQSEIWDCVHETQLVAKSPSTTYAG